MIKRYDRFIESRKNRVLPEGVYTERHHILPKCMNGSNNSDNLIRLTAREHFIAHKMLYRENKDNNKIVFAFWGMCNKQSNRNMSREYNVSSRDYEMGKLAFHEINCGENNPMYGKGDSLVGRPGTVNGREWYNNGEEEGLFIEGTQPQDWFRGRLDGMAGRSINRGGKPSWNKGKTKETDESVAKTSEKLKGRIFTDEHRLHISESCKGRKGNSTTWKKGCTPWNKGKGVSIRITNLINNESKVFTCARCDECAEFIDVKSSGSATVTVSNALKNNEGIIYRGKGKNRYKAFYIERL